MAGGGGTVGRHGVGSPDRARTVEVPKDLRETWFLWRLVAAGWCTLRELHEEWSLADALEAGRALDFAQELERG